MMDAQSPNSNHINDNHPSAPPMEYDNFLGEADFVYEIEGAPWWMPINSDIHYEPGANPDGSIPNDDNEDQKSPIEAPVAYSMDDVPVHVSVEYFDSLADDLFPEGDGVEKANQRKQARRKFLLSIDYQVNCRKYILFTSLLFFLVAMTFVASVWTDFYGVKGWGFNSLVLLLLLYGLVVGAICSNMMRYSAKCLLRMLNVYWICCWMTIIGLFATAIVYLVLFPNKFRNYCHRTESCTVNTTTLIFAECSLVSFLMVYIVLMLFYMQRVAHLVLLITNLRIQSNYRGQHESSCLMRMCHRHIYRYIIGWKTFRRIISNRTGLRMTDVLYCSCWFRRCRRQSAKPWKPLNYEELVTEENDDYSPLPERVGVDVVSDHSENEDDVKQRRKGNERSMKQQVNQQKNQQRNRQRNRQSDCWCCCDSYSGYGGGYYYGGHSDADCCFSCSLCCRHCLCSPHVPLGHHGDCNACFDACFGILCGCGDCKGCDCDCNCGGGNGGGGVCGAIMVGIICVILFLLPLIVFVLLAAPFWLLAQWITSKLNDRVPWWIVVGIFVFLLIPPCVIWYYLWGAICEGNMDGDFMNVLCMIWQFFMSMIQAFE